MQHRQLRLGDIVDDYCPRERRITNHAVVAMIAEDVKQTRCTTCDTEHEYKQARIPPQRKRREPADVAQAPGTTATPRRTIRAVAPAPDAPTAATATPAAPADGMLASRAAPETVEEPQAAAPGSVPAVEGGEEDGPVHRQLIRATLPRPEGQPQVRPLPEFTVRQSPGQARFRQGGPGKPAWNRFAPQGGRTSDGAQGPARHVAGGRPGGGGPAGRRTADRKPHQAFSTRRSHAAPVARSGKKRSK